MCEQDDNILVQRVNHGESEAFRGIVEKHQKNIFYLGLKFFHNQADAEDFAQDVFVPGNRPGKGQPQCAPLFLTVDGIVGKEDGEEGQDNGRFPCKGHTRARVH